MAIEIISTLKPKNNGTFPIAEACDIDVNGTRLDEKLESIGESGVGIVSIEETGTSGLVDTYTITLTNGNTSTFTVTNGADGVGIKQVAKTSTTGLVDTYTIQLTNNEIFQFTVTNGKDGEDGTGLSNAIIGVTTAEEMDTILASATDESVGLMYMYIGTTTDKYENGAVYRIEVE